MCTVISCKQHLVLTQITINTVTTMNTLRAIFLCSIVVLLLLFVTGCCSKATQEVLVKEISAEKGDVNTGRFVASIPVGLASVSETILVSRSRYYTKSSSGQEVRGTSWSGYSAEKTGHKVGTETFAVGKRTSRGQRHYSVQTIAVKVVSIPNPKE